jgi:hypothetical protein
MSTVGGASPLRQNRSGEWVGQEVLVGKGRKVEDLLRGSAAVGTVPVVRYVAITAASAGPGAAVDDSRKLEGMARMLLYYFGELLNGGIQFGQM